MNNLAQIITAFKNFNGDVQTKIYKPKSGYTIKDFLINIVDYKSVLRIYTTKLLR